MSYDADTARRDAEALLRRHWGHAGFRPGQWEVIEAVLQGRDVLTVMPTGGGKSICYQVPALLREGLTLVISPLIALMQDQVGSLRARSLPATFINSTLSAREVDQRWTDAEFGRYRLLYLAPERLQSELFLARADRLKVSLLAVDEAHCISEWGHHFRPAYLQIAAARARLGQPPTLALTATATPQVRRDIAEHLALRDPYLLVRGFDRPSIVWSIFRTENKRAVAHDVLRGVRGSGILYAATRRSAEAWADWLRRSGQTARAYHGGMPAAVRATVQTAWLRGETRLIAATNAFGMGIDKEDVRFVLHVDLPATLEAYYQEAGRAGRDGGKAHAVLLYGAADEQTQRALIESSYPDARQVQHVYDAVCNLAQIPLGACPEAPIPLDEEALCRLTGFPAPLVKTAVELLARAEAWQTLPPQHHHGLIRFLQPADAVRRYVEGLHNAALAHFIGALLRTVHAEAFSGFWEIDLRLLQARTGLPRHRLMRGLGFLQERGLIDWRAPETALRVLFSIPRSRQIPLDDLTVRRARRRAEERLDEMIRYARSVTCRRHFLLTYFGEANPPRCGRCDICLGRHQPVVITPEDEPVMRHILSQVAHDVPRDRWFDAAPPGRHTDGLVDWLVQEGYLRLVDPLDERFALTQKARAFLEQWKPRDAPLPENAPPGASKRNVRRDT